MDTLQLHDCSLEDTVLSALSDSVTVQFHKQGVDDGMVIFIFEKVIQLNWYIEFANCVSAQTTFMKISETGDNKLDISFIDSVIDYHITVAGLHFNKKQLLQFKGQVLPNKPILVVAGIMDAETQKPIVVTPSNQRNLPIFITLAGYLNLS